MNTKTSPLELVHNFDLFDLPIGVYFVTPDGQLLDCNQPVREMLHLPLTGPVRANVVDFYVDPRQRPDLLQKAIDADRLGLEPDVEIIALRINGRTLYVEDHCKPLRDPTTDLVVGFVGCLIDVTAEQEAARKEDELQNRISELAIDIGRVLHANTSTLLMADQTLRGVAEALGVPDAKDMVVPEAEEADESLVQHASRLANAIERLLQSTDPERRLKALSEHKWETISEQVNLLRNIRDVVPFTEMRTPTLRNSAHEVALRCREIPPGVLPRESVRDVLQEAEQLERAACLNDVLKTHNAILQMDLTLRALRDFVTSSARTPEPPTRLSVKSLIEQAVAHLAEFAKSSRVEIESRQRHLDLHVMGVERELVRALSNLLHNAIKYSWHRDRARPPWVTIRTYSRQGFVYIEFQNWGVPIEKSEVERGLIFEVGYRGKWSTDRGRLGTGIGLTDAKRVARAHEGDLIVESKPAYPGSSTKEDESYYKQPFVTTVTLYLPLAVG